MEIPGSFSKAVFSFGGSPENAANIHHMEVMRKCDYGTNLNSSPCANGSIIWKLESMFFFSFAPWRKDGMKRTEINKHCHEFLLRSGAGYKCDESTDIGLFSVLSNGS